MQCWIGFVAVAIGVALPAGAQQWAKGRLEQSPRHLDWMTAKHGDREAKCFLAFPETKERTAAVVLIHEIFGLTDWVRSVVDQLAEVGYIAIAPDLLSGAAPGAGGTAEFGSGDDVRRAIALLPPDRIIADLNAAVAHVSRLSSCNGKVTVSGFCWGGSQAFRFAAHNADLSAVFVFYGSGHKTSETSRIQAPVYGFYGGNDARLNTTLPATAAAMKAAGKIFEPVLYDGAGHGFLRAGEAPNASAGNQAARAKAWKRWKELMEKL